MGLGNGENVMRKAKTEHGHHQLWMPDRCHHKWGVGWAGCWEQLTHRIRAAGHFLITVVSLAGKLMRPSISFQPSMAMS